MKKSCLQKGLFLCGIIILCSFSKVIPEANYEIIPLPQEIKPTSGVFVLNSKTLIVYPKSNKKMEQNADFLIQYIHQATGYKLKKSTKYSPNSIILKVGLSTDHVEAYQLKVYTQHITITGASEAGVFYGIQTLRKSIPISNKSDISFPGVEINDYPRFAYRGAHLDVSRHFFSADSIKRFIDMLALHNINCFHWHLTDDQGWRIEIKKRPELTLISSKNFGTSGFYTQDEATEIVKYAQNRHINVIPEIDMPGHMQAALACYPELGCTGGPYKVWDKWGISDDVLCAGNPETLQFINDVLSEIVDIFPSKYIHVGGDECPKVRWEKCPKCQAQIKKSGFASDKEHTAEQKLQSYIINHAEHFLNQKGRQVIGWEEILEGGLASNATIMSWRDTEGGIKAAKQKHNAIMTPASYMYFDYYQTMDTDNEPPAIGGYVPVEKVYGFEPIPKDFFPEEAKYIIGVQANLWTEYIPTYNQLEYMELPRMAALSEVQWTMPQKKNYADFLKRIPRLIDIYDMEHYNYARHIFNVKVNYIPNTAKNVLEVILSTIDKAPIYYTLDGSTPTSKSEIYTDTLKITQTCILKAITIRSNGQSDLLKENIKLNKASLKPITVLKPINEKYKFEGKNTLIDGLSGSRNYRTGRWIAFYKNDMDIIVDLQQKVSLSKAWVRNYVEIGEEIFDIRKFSIAISDDGKDFKEIKSVSYPSALKDDENGIFLHELFFDNVQTRYVKLTAQPEYSIPDWHWGKKRPAFIFIDEIGLE